MTTGLPPQIEDALKALLEPRQTQLQATIERAIQDAINPLRVQLHQLEQRLILANDQIQSQAVALAAYRNEDRYAQTRALVRAVLNEKDNPLHG